MNLDVETFVRGFVAGLIDADATAIRPGRSEHRHGFKQVLDILDQEVERSQTSKRDDQGWYKQVVRLRNGLRPSNSGTFDNFEMALRDLQLSLTNCPNPFYEEIAFSVSKPYAQSIFNDMPDPQRNLVARAVEAFLGASMAKRKANAHDER